METWTLNEIIELQDVTLIDEHDEYDIECTDELDSILNLEEA